MKRLVMLGSLIAIVVAAGQAGTREQTIDLALSSIPSPVVVPDGENRVVTRAG